MDPEPTETERRIGEALKDFVPSVIDEVPHSIVFYEDRTLENITAALERGEGFLRVQHDDGTFTDYPVRSVYDGETNSYRIRGSWCPQCGAELSDGGRCEHAPDW